MHSFQKAPRYELFFLFTDSMKFQYKLCNEIDIIAVIKYWLVKAKERIKIQDKARRQENDEH